MMLRTGWSSIGFEAQVTVGDDADDQSVHRATGTPGDPVQARDREDVAHRSCSGVIGDRILDDAALEALDLRHLGRLLPRV
jgi:hypothetical protein